MYIEFPLANCCSKSQRISSLSIRSSEPLTAPSPVRFRGMNWVQRKIFLYNVTFGLYMLDWWERCLFNILVIVLMWFIFYNSSRYVTVFLKGVTGQSAKPVTMTQDVPYGGLSIRRGTFSSRELARFKELLEKPIRLKFGWPDNKDMAT